MKRFGLFLIPAVLLLAGLFFSCEEEKELPLLELPSTAIVTGESKYAVVKVPYTRLYDSAETGEDYVLMLRKGDILPLISRKTVQSGNQYSLWYEVNFDNHIGWAEASHLDFFATEDQAKTGREQLLGE